MIRQLEAEIADRKQTASAARLTRFPPGPTATRQKANRLGER